MFFETVVGDTIVQWAAILLPSQRIFFLYLLSAFVIAICTYVYFSYREENARPDGVKKGLLRYIFDPEVWWHKSARQDYVFFVVNALIYSGILSQLLIGAHVFYALFQVGLEATFGVPESAFFEPSALTVVVYTLVAILFLDFGVWLSHYVQHKVMPLWQFHMVHHSAEVLTPMTVYRMHPVDLFITGLTTGLLIGMGFAGYVYLTGAMPSEVNVMNVNIILFTFYMIGYNLRHSHIWVSYPRWLSYIFISPAQHQTHHSIDEKHYDRNFGLIFAFWDWMFGTLYVPKGYEKLEFGVAREEPNPFSSITQIYFKPFKEAWKLVRPTTAQESRRMIAVTTIAVATLGFIFVSTTQASGPQASATFDGPRTVHLEDLTWTEVAAAQSLGFDTIIIPTGGTEQNGPHVILGKHNYVVRRASHNIAHALGDTLVAPVLAYVPEGDHGAEKTGHMRWTGTLSVNEPIFEAVLESAARSYKAHGFSKIVFVGDSLGNQEGQLNVAAKLSEEWASEDIMIASLSEYYDANGQTDYLLSEGYTEAEIGGHAGIRDTSEMLWIAPHGVRDQIVAAPTDANPGYSGAPSEASAEIGRKMLDLKVEAAVRQFHAIEEARIRQLSLYQ